MCSNLRRVLFVLLMFAIAGAGSLAWAAHGGGNGHGGGGGWSGGGGHGWSGGGGHGWSGGDGHVSVGHFDGHGSFNHWGGGYGWPYSYFSSPYWYGYSSYPSGYYYGYPYYYSYPGNYYAFSYPYYYSYPGDYYTYGDGDSYSATPQSFDSPPPQQYVASRPIGDVARMEVRLPDPNCTLWVQGQQMQSTGSVRNFLSPQLDPSQQYTYNVKAAWNDNGKLVTDERQVKVQANGLAVVDFTRPVAASADRRDATMPPLPPPARQTR